MRELSCRGLAVYGSCSEGESGFGRVMVCVGDGASELQCLVGALFGSGSVGELWCVAVAVWRSCSVGKLQCVGVMLVSKHQLMAFFTLTVFSAFSANKTKKIFPATEVFSSACFLNILINPGLI